jgi:hypothetical protein
MTGPSPKVSTLALLLARMPPADLIATAAGLLDSLPIGCYVAACGDDLRVVYANRAAESWVARDKLPLTGSLLEETIESAEGNGFLEELARVCLSGQARHLRRFSVPGFSNGSPQPPEHSLWDLELCPLVDAWDNVTHVLTCGLESKGEVDVARRQAGHSQAGGERPTEEEAPGVIRMFGIPAAGGSSEPDL